MKCSDLCYLPIAELAPLLKGRRVSPVEVTTAYLDRISALNPKINAYVTVLAEEALSAARRAEAEIAAGHYRGPLHGVPVAVKDMFHMRGVPTTAGSRVMADFIPDFDATVIQRLKDAGAILLGKLHMPEFAMSSRTTNDMLGPCRNPWNLDHFPGGSSSGPGAATAAGMCAGSLGSDTAGSVRLPAALSGVVGLKPTYGRVSRFGGVPVAPTLDQFGPITRTVADCALMLQSIAGYDSLDPTCSQAQVPDYASALDADIKGLVIGMPSGEYWSSGVDAEVLSRVREAIATLERLGLRIQEIPLEADGVLELLTIIVFAEAASAHGHWVRTRPRDLEDCTRTRLEIGHLILAMDYLRALEARKVLASRFREVLQKVDVLVTPTTLSTAPRIGDDIAYRKALTRAFLGSQPRLTGPFSLTGLPAISVPCGVNDEGLPVGIQIAGRPFDEVTILRVAYTYEQASEWHKRRPPL